MSVWMLHLPVPVSNCEERSLMKLANQLFGLRVFFDQRQLVLQLCQCLRILDDSRQAFFLLLLHLSPVLTFLQCFQVYLLSVSSLQVTHYSVVYLFVYVMHSLLLKPNFQSYLIFLQLSFLSDLLLLVFSPFADRFASFYFPFSLTLRSFCLFSSFLLFNLLFSIFNS